LQKPVLERSGKQEPELEEIAPLCLPLEWLLCFDRFACRLVTSTFFIELKLI
jgi:hypothetical protein